MVALARRKNKPKGVGFSSRSKNFTVQNSFESSNGTFAKCFKMAVLEEVASGTITNATASGLYLFDTLGCVKTNPGSFIHFVFRIRNHLIANCLTFLSLSHYCTVCLWNSCLEFQPACWKQRNFIRVPELLHWSTPQPSGHAVSDGNPGKPFSKVTFTQRIVLEHWWEVAVSSGYSVLRTGSMLDKPSRNTTKYEAPSQGTTGGFVCNTG